MNIRTATIKDLEAVTSVEAECFPPAEAATREELAERLKYYADHFWLMFDGDKLIAFVDGFVTDEENLTDEMYAKAQLHNESGAWQMIFGVNTIPAYRKHGYAGELIKCAIEDARKKEIKVLVLTCMDHLVQYYAITGFATGSPRDVLRQSFQANLITGDEWMDMLKIRNQLPHDYDGLIVKEHCQTIVNEYIDKMYEFKIAVETLLKEDK